MVDVKLTETGLSIADEEIPVYSGEVHYWRLKRDLWPQIRDRIQELGFGMVETSIPWSVHEIAPGSFDWGRIDARKDVEAFLRLCEERSLWLLVHPGPLINAELTDFGFPEWVPLDPAVQASCKPLVERDGEKGAPKEGSVRKQEKRGRNSSSFARVPRIETLSMGVVFLTWMMSTVVKHRKENKDVSSSETKMAFRYSLYLSFHDTVYECSGSPFGFRRCDHAGGSGGPERTRVRHCGFHQSSQRLPVCKYLVSGV